MKTQSVALFFSLTLMATGCLPAVSTTFESARMLAPKAVEVQGYGSLYAGITDSREADEWGLRTLNFGATAAYGLSTKFSVRARFEQTFLTDRSELFNAPLLPVGSRVNYSEIGLKYGWRQAKRFSRAAVSLPIGYISYANGGIWCISPTAFATYSKNNQFEVGLNGKLHFWFNGAPAIPWTSIGVGFGFSKDLNRWAIRPEINTDIYNVSVGIGFSYIFPVH
jgi:hypothetical protein